MLTALPIEQNSLDLGAQSWFFTSLKDTEGYKVSEPDTIYSLQGYIKKRAEWHTIN